MNGKDSIYIVSALKQTLFPRLNTFQGILSHNNFKNNHVTKIELYTGQNTNVNFVEDLA